MAPEELMHVGRHKEDPVEQQHGARGAATAQAARTVLPGEPFDPPMPQVPRPRDEQVPVTMLPPQQLAPPQMTPQHGNYGAAQEPQTGDLAAPEAAVQFVPPEAAAPFAPATMPGSNAFETLQDYASLPAAGRDPAPAAAEPAAPVFAPAGYPQDQAAAPWPTDASVPGRAYGAPYPGMPDEPQFAPADYPAQTALMPPLSLAPLEDESPGRQAPDKRLLAVAIVAAVAVVAGGGYFGYTTFIKSDSTTPPRATTPVIPHVVPAPAYAFPSNIAGLKLQSTPDSTRMQVAALAQAKQAFPLMAKTLSFASYNAGQPTIIATTFHPAAAQLAAGYRLLLKFSATPDKGSVAVRPHVAVPGAAGGSMQCGGESGRSTYAYCVWQGATTVGVLQVSGSPKTLVTEILTRELRAYAEH